MENSDICGLCGEPEADKIAQSSGYWPDQKRPDGKYVHSSCEMEEQRRAWNALSQNQRDAVLKRLR